MIKNYDKVVERFMEPLCQASPQVQIYSYLDDAYVVAKEQAALALAGLDQIFATTEN